MAALGACEAGFANEAAPNGGFGDEGTASGDPSLAQGISITSIEVNQGTEITVAIGEEGLAPAQRSGALLASRDALVRVRHEVADDWVAREIEARLILSLPDGGVRSLSEIEWIAGDSTDELTGSFDFHLDTVDALTQPGVAYQVELWDLGEVGASADTASEGVVLSPAVGFAELGFEAQAMVIEIVFVPVTHDGLTPSLDEATLARFVDSIYEHNPVTQVRWSLREPAIFEGNLFELAQLLPFVSALREADEAAPQVYYHALIDVGAPSLAGVQGIAEIAGDQPEDAGARVQATVMWSGDPDAAVETLTHELGHGQGLRHVECPLLDADATDPSYPNADGHLGADGYALRRRALFEAQSAYDYMSYCDPSFVSDWTWARSWARISTLTSWSEAGDGDGDGDGGGDGDSEGG
ncbi:hypothetical protein G6O69_30195 [Pseudenhygromyxa sp. WMMC2535]|uniref:hypothetical protein n=1 Tax=Pseudenhygromyxa sp. WMMC2535 TaxID=2712867 RepID=UPI001595F981|nr:hypothetical protein [Pseudenhygromyxa sp. WMMC2535]NVB42132.1 hypothetical protein [Pseudenhygromyxa sp. WMMC2535]